MGSTPESRYLDAMTARRPYVGRELFELEAVRKLVEIALHLSVV
jgi:hypothetical protein